MSLPDQQLAKLRSYLSFLCFLFRSRSNESWMPVNQLLQHLMVGCLAPEVESKTLLGTGQAYCLVGTNCIRRIIHGAAG